MKKVIIYLLSTSFLSLVITFNVSAQSFDTSALEELPDEIKENLKKLNLRAVVEGKVAIPTPSFTLKLKDSNWESTLPITLHLKGAQGTALAPFKERAKKISKQDSTIALKSYQSEIKKIFDQTKERYTKLPPLKACAKDSNIFEPYPTETSGGVLSDVLFISAEQMPSEPSEVFGKNIVAVLYDPKQPNSWAFLAQFSKVSCLPSRVRILGRGVSRLQGLDALKNFDDNLYGPGTIHEVMKPKLQRLFDQSGNAL